MPLIEDFCARCGQPLDPTSLARLGEDDQPADYIDGQGRHVLAHGTCGEGAGWARA